MHRNWTNDLFLLSYAISFQNWVRLVTLSIYRSNIIQGTHHLLRYPFNAFKRTFAMPLQKPIHSLSVYGSFGLRLEKEAVAHRQRLTRKQLMWVTDSFLYNEKYNRIFVFASSPLVNHHCNGTWWRRDWICLLSVRRERVWSWKRSRNGWKWTWRSRINWMRVEWERSTSYSTGTFTGSLSRSMRSSGTVQLRRRRPRRRYSVDFIMYYRPPITLIPI